MLLRGLSTTRFNNKTEVLVDWDATQTRWHVGMDGKDTTISVRIENLVLLDDEATRPPPFLYSLSESINQHPPSSAADPSPTQCLSTQP